MMIFRSNTRKWRPDWKEPEKARAIVSYIYTLRERPEEYGMTVLRRSLNIGRSTNYEHISKRAC